MKSDYRKMIDEMLSKIKSEKKLKKILITYVLFILKLKTNKRRLENEIRYCNQK